MESQSILSARSSPAERVHSASNRVRATLLAIGGVLFFANATAGWFLQRYSPNLGYVLIREKWKLLEELKTPVDWLILGDSSGNQAVIPELIRKRLGLSSVNLCTIADTLLTNDARMLQAYIKRHGTPKRVLLVHAYDVWPREPNPSVMAQIPQVDADGMIQRVNILVSKFVPLYSENKSIRQLLRAGRTLEPSRRPFDADGYMSINGASPEWVGKEYALRTEALKERNFLVSLENQKAFNEMLQLSDRLGFELVYVQSPLYDRLSEDKQFKRFYQQFFAYLHQTAAKHPRLTIAFKHPVGFPASQLQNVDHVIDEGAKQFTETLMTRLADRRHGMVPGQ